MITREQMIQLLLQACPSFQSEWDKHLAEHDEEILYYIVLSGFARHLLELHQKKEVETFPAVAQVIERLHIEGDGYVQEAATIGLLEGIQNSWGNNHVDPELFFPYLLPVSGKWLRSLNDFWSGKSKFVGEGLTKDENEA
jgi:hypothetical protein